MHWTSSRAARSRPGSQPCSGGSRSARSAAPSPSASARHWRGRSGSSRSSPQALFLVFAYNLELFGGLFHTDLWFALAWGAFPLLTGYFVVAEELTVEALLAAVFAVATSLAQRALDTCSGGAAGPSNDPPSTIVGPERARALTVAMVALALALLALRW